LALLGVRLGQNLNLQTGDLDNTHPVSGSDVADPAPVKYRRATGPREALVELLKAGAQV
jgi:hypothetical protein